MGAREIRGTREGGRARERNRASEIGGEEGRGRERNRASEMGQAR